MTKEIESRLFSQSLPLRARTHYSISFAASMFKRGFRARQDEKVLRLFAVILGVSSGVYIFKDSFEKNSRLATTIDLKTEQQQVSKSSKSE